MTTYNRTVNQSGTPLSGQVSRNGRIEVMIDEVIDLSATGNTYSVGDVFNVLQVPAGYSLTCAGIEVVRADTAGNSGTLALKLGSTALGTATTVAATGFNTTAQSLTPQSPSGSTQYISLTSATGLVNAVIRVWAVINDVRFTPNAGVVTGVGTNPAGQATVTAVDPYLNYTGTSALTFVL